MNTDYTLTKNDTLVLKGIAIIGMLCWHLFFATRPEECGVEFSRLTRFIGIIGDVCVSIFLFVSGYGLTITERDRNGNWLRWLLIRYIKFYFNFWPILILGTLIGSQVFNIPICGESGILSILECYFEQLFALSGQGSYNNSWWFNSLIITFYGLFPLLFQVVKKLPVYLLIVSLLLTSCNFRIGYDIGLYSLVFISGMCLAYHSDVVNRFLSRFGKKTMCLVVVFGFCFSLVYLKCLGEDGIFARGIKSYALLTWLFALATCLSLRKYNWVYRILSFLGRHSANIYLVHTFLYYYWFMDFFYGLRHPLLILGTLVVFCLAISFIIERIKSSLGVYKLQTYLIDRIE